MTKQPVTPQPIDYLKLKKSALGKRGERAVALDQKIPKLVKERTELTESMKRDAEVITLLEEYTTRKKELTRLIPKLEKRVTTEIGVEARVSLIELKTAQDELAGLDEKMRLAYYAR